MPIHLMQHKMRQIRIRIQRIVLAVLVKVEIVSKSRAGTQKFSNRVVPIRINIILILLV